MRFLGGKREKNLRKEKRRDGVGESNSRFPWGGNQKDKGMGKSRGMGKNRRV
jgi:hypothetical protein